jgi:hexulose-6-phosphate isomerase
MKRGIFQGCFPSDISTLSCLSLTSKLGFDGLELVMDDSSPVLPEALGECAEDILAIGKSVGVTSLREDALTLTSSESEIARLEKTARSANTRVHSIATMLLFYYPLSSALRAVRDRGIDVVLRMLRAAAILRADTILIVPGLVTPSVGYKVAYERSQAVLRDLETEARRLKIVMAIENVWNRFLLSPLEMARYVDELDSPWVGAYVDVANLLTYGYPEDWISILGPRVKGVHFKDFRKDIDNILGFVHLLHGDVNWPGVVRALRDICYDGYVTVEVPPLKILPLKGISDAMTSLEAILSGSVS